jgi:hypothetical protein
MLCCTQLEAASEARDWSLGMVNFEDILSKLKEIKSTDAKAGGSSNGGTSDEPGAPPAKKKGKKQKLTKDKQASAEEIEGQASPPPSAMSCRSLGSLGGHEYGG